MRFATSVSAAFVAAFANVFVVAAPTADAIVSVEPRAADEIHVSCPLGHAPYFRKLSHLSVELAYLAACAGMLVDLTIFATTKVVAVGLRIVPVAASLIPITQSTVAWLNVSGLNSVHMSK